MRLLLDTHLLLWAVGMSHRLSAPVRELLDDSENQLCFSSASLWEIAIKSGMRREEFDVDVRLVRRALLNSDYVELPITGEHAVTVADLPPLHKDPFDRLLIAQSVVEGITLLTADAAVARYPGPIRRV